jgi:hypothetical protein
VSEAVRSTPRPDQAKAKQDTREQAKPGIPFKLRSKYQRVFPVPELSAASILPTHDPKPMVAYPCRQHLPRNVISSPSSKKPRRSRFGSATGFDPALVNSSMLLSSAGLGPEIVPVPMRSPGCRLQPLMV